MAGQTRLKEVGSVPGAGQRLPPVGVFPRTWVEVAELIQEISVLAFKSGLQRRHIVVKGHDLPASEAERGSERSGADVSVIRDPSPGHRSRF